MPAGEDVPEEEGVDDPLFEEELEAEIRKRCEKGFNQNFISHRRVSDLLCQVGQCYECLKQHLPQFEQQRAEWLLDQLFENSAIFGNLQRGGCARSFVS